MQERMCVVCRTKNNKSELFRIIIDDEEQTFDIKQKVQKRGIYLCKEYECLQKFSKNKRYKPNPDLLMEILKSLENIKNKNSIKDILRHMSNSSYLVYGVDDNKELMKKGKIDLIILPKDLKENQLNSIIKETKHNNVRVLFIESKKDFFDIFGTNLNVLGITGKKIVEGILKKTEVADEST